MKTSMLKNIVPLVVLATALTLRAQPEDAPPADDVVANAAAAAANLLNPEPDDDDPNGSAATEQQQQALGQLIQAVVEAHTGTNGEATAEGESGKGGDERSSRRIRGEGTRGTTGLGTNAISLTAFAASQSTNQMAGAEATLRLNFRNAPLSMVLDYLSDAAGFTISANSKVDLKGAITVWSNRPVTRGEAVQLLNEALTSSGYGATVEGNLLNVFVVDATNTRIIAGVPNNDYSSIPATKELVTQVVYVNNVEANPLITSLQPLMPTGTSMTANQAANAIVITDTKANIRRMVQLVKALDTAGVTAATLRVFPLTYAEAASLAQVVTQLFQAESSSGSRGGPPFGFFPGGYSGRDRGSSRGEGSGSAQAGRVASPKITAVADDRSNSLVVSAGEEQMALVEELVNQMDVDVDDKTELRVFRLRYADPQETADQLTSLFPDPITQQGSRTSSRSSSPYPFPFSRDRSSGSSGNTTGIGSRTLNQAKVTAVPDPRTGSVIVSASRDLMPQITDIIYQLDSDPAKKKQVYVIKVENRDPQEVVEQLQEVIATDSAAGLNSSRSRSSQSGSQLSTRQQNATRNQGAGESVFNTGSSRSRTGR